MIKLRGAGHTNSKYFTFIRLYILTNFFTMKSTDALISKFILVRNSTCSVQFLCPSSGAFHCTFGTGTCYTGLTIASVQDQDGTTVPF